MADTTTLLKVAYGTAANLPSNKVDGTIYVLTDDSHKIGIKLPNVNFFYLKGDGYPTTLPNPANAYMYYGASTVATDAVSYNGGTATNFYSGARPIVVAAVTDTSEATTDTTNPYVLIQSRNGSNSWVNVGGF